MNRWLVLPVALLLSWFLLAHAAQANDQEFVVGVGLGGHSFSDSDDFREGSAAFGGADEIDAGVLFHLYGEWYVFDDVGLGLRSIGIGGGRTYESAEARIEQSVAISAQLITVQWIPVGSEDYVRLGLLAGLGVASYEARSEFTDKTGALGGDVDESESTSGSASLAGLFVDWGADGFGARFGMNVLNTDLDPIESNGQEYQVDGSGAHWYFDLRWAFN